MCYYLSATIDPTSEGKEGFEGEDFAGEGPGQPGTTGKPPLALASLLSYVSMHMLWLINCIKYSVGDGVHPAL